MTKRPVLHSFHMSTGRCSETGSGVTAGVEISLVWRQEEAERSSVVKSRDTVKTPGCL